MPDLNCNDLDGAVLVVSGTARSMGIQVGDEPVVLDSGEGDDGEER